MMNQKWSEKFSRYYPTIPAMTTTTGRVGNIVDFVLFLMKQVPCSFLPCSTRGCFWKEFLKKENEGWTKYISPYWVSKNSRGKYFEDVSFFFVLCVMRSSSLFSSFFFLFAALLLLLLLAGLLPIISCLFLLQFVLGSRDRHKNTVESTYISKKEIKSR